MEKLEGAGKGGNFQPEICTTGALDSGKLGGGGGSGHSLTLLKLKALLHYALIHLRFYFSRVFDTNMLVSKTRVKPRENSEKNKKKREPNARQCFYITLCVG